MLGRTVIADTDTFRMVKWRWPSMFTGWDAKSEELCPSGVIFNLLIAPTPLGLLIRGRTRWVIIRW